MTITERNDKLKCFITCLKCELSGKCCDDECSTQYDAGNMGEIVENLEAISKLLDQELEVIERWKDGAFMDSINAFRAIREVLGDTNEKLEIVVEDLQDGKITPNQAREKFNLPPIESTIDKIKTEIKAYAKATDDEKYSRAYKACLHVIDYYANGRDKND